MLSLRSLTRSAPRVASRLAASSIRKPATRQASILQSSWQPTRLQCASAFSTSARRAAVEGDQELILKLKDELEMEKEMRGDDEVPVSVKDYLSNSPFKIQDTPGKEEVYLTRKFGNETIRVSFSTADLNAMDPEAAYDEDIDRAIADEDVKANAELERDEDQGEMLDDEEGFPGSSFPVRLNVIIEKGKKGALAIEAVAEEGTINIENAYYYKDAAHAYAEGPKETHDRMDLYIGPPFGNLDQDLQVLFESYLDERGINTAMAIFIPDYIDMKEGKEYINWLKDVKSFIEA